MSRLRLVLVQAPQRTPVLSHEERGRIDAFTAWACRRCSNWQTTTDDDFAAVPMRALSLSILWRQWLEESAPGHFEKPEFETFESIANRIVAFNESRVTNAPRALRLVTNREIVA